MSKITATGAAAQKREKSQGEFLAQEISQENAPNDAVVNQTMRQMIEEADTNLLLIIKEMRAGARAEEQNDPGTVDLFSRHVQIHERAEWWLRDILEKRDGLVA